VVIGNGSAWITHFEGPISRFSTSTGTKLGDSRGKGNYQGETLVGSSLWVVEDTHRLLIQVRIKPDTFLGGKVVRVGTAPYAVVSGFGSLWVNNFVDTTVSRIAPATGKVKRSIDRVGSALGPDSITAALGRIWVTDQDKNRLLGINPKRNTVDRKLHAGPMPVSVASEGSRLWVTNYKAGTVSIVTP